MILAFNDSQGELHFKDKVETNVFNKILADFIDYEKCKIIRIKAI